MIKWQKDRQTDSLEVREEKRDRQTGYYHTKFIEVREEKTDR
jgi:hypothetical protein